MKISIDNKKHLVNIIPTEEEEIYDVRIGKKRFLIKNDHDNIKVKKNRENGYSVSIGNDHFYVEIQKKANTEKNEITSPIKGMVQKVFVTPGQKVKKGQTLIEIFAMKLENQILAERRGIISQVFVADGDIVDKGEPIIEIKR